VSSEYAPTSLLVYVDGTDDEEKFAKSSYSTLLFDDDSEARQVFRKRVPLIAGLEENENAIDDDESSTIVATEASRRGSIRFFIARIVTEADFMAADREQRMEDGR
jgi:hypothetical protein